jgi:phosphatidylserine decarboxylase
MSTNVLPSLSARINTRLLRLLPQHRLSRGMYHLARCKISWLKNAIIRFVVKRYQVDMQLAKNANPLSYASFNAFFTRELRQEARPITDTGIACPADGKMSQCGIIQEQQLLQAKGHYYSLYALLAGDKQLSAEFTQGSFATVYLSPRDYHRIHMPLAGTLREMIFVPGNLFSVSEDTAQLVPELFARNERLVCIFDTERGPMAVILVGAIFVGSMQTVWAGEVQEKQIKRWTYPENPPQLDKGTEMGRFNMGSTVILLFAKDRAELLPQLSGQTVQMGQKIAD